MQAFNFELSGFKNEDYGHLQRQLKKTAFKLKLKKYGEEYKKKRDTKA